MPDEVVSTPYGQFYVDPDDCIGGTLKAGTIWDGPGFLQVIFKEHYQPGTTVVDVGANFGSFTVYAAAMGAWRVVAVEPAPETLRYLKATLDLNKGTCADRVILLPIAAYDQRVELGSYDWSRRNIGGASMEPVTRDGFVYLGMAAPLDDYQHLWGRKVSLIKIDAQGCDGAVLRGLEQTLQRDHPAVVFEWEERLAGVHGYSLPDTLHYLGLLGYQTREWPSHKDNYLAVWKGER